MRFLLYMFLCGLVCACSDSPEGTSEPQQAQPDAAPIVSLEATPQSVSLGESTVLAWNATNEATCVASEGWNGTLAASGERPLTPVNPGDTTYTIQCSNGLGSSSQSVTVTATTALSQRLPTVTAVDETDYPYEGSVQLGALPADGTGPDLTVTSSTNTARGGGTIISVESTRPLVALLLGAENVAGSASHYEIDLTTKAAAVESNADGSIVYTLKHAGLSVSSTTRGPTALQARKQAQQARTQAASPLYLYDLQVNISESLPEDSLRLSIVGVYAADAPANTASARRLAAPTAESASAQRSPQATSTVTVSAAAATSPYLAITLNWNQPVDLDLHVTTPSGTEISYANLRADGGALDLDAWPACGEPHGNAEHVTWSDSRPPPRIYSIQAVFYDRCNVTVAVPYILIVSNNGQRRTYRETDTKPFYTAVLAAPETDAGLIALMLINETIAPGNPGYDASEAQTAMKALRAIVENRKVDPGTFSSRSSSTRDIIITPASKCQFDKFCGSISNTAINHAKEVLVPLYKLKMDEYKTYYESLFTAAESSSADDPYKATTKIGDVNIESGSFAVFRSGGNPGGSFVRFPDGQDISGQDFFGLKTGVLRRR